MPTRLILIRHGETDWSREKRYCGFTDVPLNENGRIQARGLSKGLKEEKIERVYSSDMKRTLQFARIVFKGMPVEEFSELREINFGAFEGLAYQEIMYKYREIYTRWIKNPVDVAIPDGEGLKDLAKRVRIRLTDILTHNKGKTVAIVSHGGPIRVILCDILRLELNRFWQIKLDTASINIVWAR